MHRDPNRTFGYFMESCVSERRRAQAVGSAVERCPGEQASQLSAADVGRAGCRGPLPVREPSCTA
jgi:hypothetical protein